MGETMLNRTVKILLLVFLLALILVKGKPLLVPLTFAALFAMLLLPVSEWMQRRGIGRGLSIVASVLLIVLFFAGIIALLAWQVSDMAQNASQIEQNISQKAQQVRDYVTNSLGISEQKQQEMMQKQQQSSGGKTASMISGAFASAGSILTDFLLMLVYIFLFLYFRTHLKKFLLRLVPKEDEGKTKQIVDNSRKVAQKYLTGLMLMIVGLWIMYSIGFAIAGVKNFFFFAVLCGLLEIVPFVGNILGNALTIIVTLAQGGTMNVVIGILITYAVVQFIQSYLLEPLVVGSEVNINPVFTIVGIIAGEFIWGIPGMILALPVLGILKIVCDHIEPLKPYGFLIGEEKNKQEPGWLKKVKHVFGGSDKSG